LISVPVAVTIAFALHPSNSPKRYCVRRDQRRRFPQWRMGAGPRMTPQPQSIKSLRRAGSGVAAVAVTAFDRVVPPDSLHEDIDTTRRRGTVVHVIHVEHENQPPAGECRGVVGSPLIDQPLVSRRIGENRPSGSAGLRKAICFRFESKAFRSLEALVRTDIGSGALNHRRPRELTRNSSCQNTGRAKGPSPLCRVLLCEVLATSAWQRSIARSKKIAAAT
jgi:hypothetical protein